MDLETNQVNHKDLSLRSVWVTEEMAHIERMMMGSGCLAIGLSFIGVNINCIIIYFIKNTSVFSYKIGSIRL